MYQDQDKVVTTEGKQYYEKCGKCNGDGYTLEHDPHPHENGDCQGMCPIQVQCEKCEATGYIPVSLSDLIREAKEEGWDMAIANAYDPDHYPNKETYINSLK